MHMIMNYKYDYNAWARDAFLLRAHWFCIYCFFFCVFFSQFTDNKYCLTLYNMFIYILHYFMHIFIVFISFSLSFIDGLKGVSKWYYCSTALVQALMFVVVKLLPNG